MTGTLLGGRRTLSTRATGLFAAVTAVSFSATSSAPTPLYHLYQETMQLSPLVITLVFAAYAFAMLGSFLTVAKLSDYVGRRPMILSALLLNAVALLLFIFAAEAWELILARIVQGFATGIAITTLGAAILDADRKNGTIINSITAFIGLMAGALVSGVLVAYAPLPTQLIYIVLLAVTLAEVVVLMFAPETTSGRTGALRALVPSVKVPKAAVGMLIRLLPLNVAGWALGGFYLSLMPSLVVEATGSTSLFIGAAVVSALMATASLMVFVLRGLRPEHLLMTGSVSLGLGVAVTLGGVALGSAPVMFLGAIVAGVGFGASYSGNLRALLPLAGEHERAGLLAAYFVESYVTFAVPAIIAGLVAPSLGLITTAYAYGGVVILLAVVAFFATRPSAKDAPLRLQ